MKQTFKRLSNPAACASSIATATPATGLTLNPSHCRLVRFRQRGHRRGPRPVARPSDRRRLRRCAIAKPVRIDGEAFLGGARRSNGGRRRRAHRRLLQHRPSLCLPTTLARPYPAISYPSAAPPCSKALATGRTAPGRRAAPPGPPKTLRARRAFTRPSCRTSAFSGTWTRQ